MYDVVWNAQVSHIYYGRIKTEWLFYEICRCAIFIMEGKKHNVVFMNNRKMSHLLWKALHSWMNVHRFFDPMWRQYVVHAFMHSCIRSSMHSYSIIYFSSLTRSLFRSLSVYSGDKPMNGLIDSCSWSLVYSMFFQHVHPKKKASPMYGFLLNTELYQSYFSFFQYPPRFHWWFWEVIGRRS
jgi:hypothetical protein